VTDPVREGGPLRAGRAAATKEGHPTTVTATASQPRKRRL
jgi:hypothetical protein